MEKNRKTKASTLEKNIKRGRKDKSQDKSLKEKSPKDKSPKENSPKEKVAKEKVAKEKVVKEKVVKEKVVKEKVVKEKIAKDPVKTTKVDKKIDKSKKVKETTKPENILVSDPEPVVIEILDKKSLSIDSIFEQVSKLITIIDIELLRMKGSPTKNTSAGRFLRKFKKQISTVRSNCGKLMKKKPKKPETKRTGGLAKPVEISSDLSTFAGWPDGELKSRVDVTRYICNYIKENELQNPENRRFIVPDKKLHTLLGSNDSGEPLRYCDIQSRLKARNHFVS